MRKNCAINQLYRPLQVTLLDSSDIFTYGLFFSSCCFLETHLYLDSSTGFRPTSFNHKQRHCINPRSVQISNRHYKWLSCKAFLCRRTANGPGSPTCWFPCVVYFIESKCPTVIKPGTGTPVYNKANVLKDTHKTSVHLVDPL